MKVLALILTILLTSSFSKNDLELEEIRQNYQLAVTDKDICQSMINRLSNHTPSNIYLAYYGAFQTIWANHTFNPFNKLKTFNEGRRNINKAAKLEPKNVEIIFIRHSIQKNCPEFLDYKQNMREDHKILSKEVDNIKVPSLKRMVEKLLNS